MPSQCKVSAFGVKKDCTLIIGDIIATGDTLRLCLDQVVDRFRRRGGSIRKIVFFTIGGTRAIELMEAKREEIRKVFPEFEGFECFFYEGIFTVYTGPGASGINVPDIDFGWKGGAVAPEFRRYVMDHPYSILEKCIIYDGGARRYEIPIHFREALEYWEGIWGRADLIDPVKLVGEKLGYTSKLFLEETHLSLGRMTKGSFPIVSTFLNAKLSPKSFSSHKYCEQVNNNNNNKTLLV